MNKVTPSKLLAIALAFLIYCQAGAQSSAADMGEDYAFVARSDQQKQVKSAYRPNSGFLVAQRLSGIYTGYAIELANSNLPLDRHHRIFRQFGNVRYHKLSDGRYSYVITAEFSSSKAAEEFLQNIIKPRVPSAKLFIYKDGQRKELGG